MNHRRLIGSWCAGVATVGLLATELGRSGAPNARTAREQTRTLPNHTGMLTGRRIDDRRGGHGVTFNSDTGTTVHRAAGEYVTSVFDVVHDRGGSTALFTAKKKFALYLRAVR
ncbi:MAG TPA: hypothetical protein VMT27_10190, partial [Actinomycetes bacterium]|nr:hypothetical protein [Actinomycetes bacterium]